MRSARGIITGMLFSLLGSVCAGGANDKGALSFPHIDLTRELTQGVENYDLTCHSDTAGTALYLCQLTHKINNLEIESRWLYAKQLEPMLDRFFSSISRSSKRSRVIASGRTGLSWRVTARGQSVTGTSIQQSRLEKNGPLDAILALEVDLASAFMEP